MSSIIKTLLMLIQLRSLFGSDFDLPYGYVKRNVWKAKPSKHVLIDTHVPVSKVIIAHTNTTMCDTPDYNDPCDMIVRLIQEVHLNRSNHYDIGYNFLIGGDGKVYEGRGWYANGVHTMGYNDKSRAIAFIGRYNDVHEEPALEQLKAAQALIQQGITLGIVSKDYLLYGQRSLVTTDSPGDILFNVIKEWDRFSPGN